MEKCERCENIFDIKQNLGDYVYYRNDCLEVTDYNEMEVTQ